MYSMNTHVCGPDLWRTQEAHLSIKANLTRSEVPLN